MCIILCIVLCVMYLSFVKMCNHIFLSRCFDAKMFSLFLMFWKNWSCFWSSHNLEAYQIKAIVWQMFVVMMALAFKLIDCGSCLPQVEDEFLASVRIGTSVDLIRSTILTCLFTNANFWTSVDLLTSTSLGNLHMCKQTNETSGCK